MKPLIITISGEPWTKADMVCQMLSEGLNIPLIPIYTDEKDCPIPGSIYTPRWLLNRIEPVEKAMHWRTNAKHVYKAAIVDIAEINLSCMGSSKMIQSFYFGYSNRYDLVKIRIKNEEERLRQVKVCSRGDMFRQQSTLNRAPDWLFDYTIETTSPFQMLYQLNNKIKLEIEKWKNKTN